MNEYLRFILFVSFIALCAIVWKAAIVQGCEFNPVVPGLSGHGAPKTLTTTTTTIPFIDYTGQQCMNVSRSKYYYILIEKIDRLQKTIEEMENGTGSR